MVQLLLAFLRVWNSILEFWIFGKRLKVVVRRLEGWSDEEDVRRSVLTVGEDTVVS